MRKSDMPLEAEEQRTVVEYCDLKSIPVFHIPNGGSRNKIEAARLKMQGVRPGVPDLFVPVARGKYHGLFIEMKRKKGYHVAPAQQAWIERLNANGYMAYVCPGADSAIELIRQYMTLD